MAEWNCFLCKEFQSGTACTFCDDGSEFRKMTNADKIRSMTDEELAELFSKLAWNSEVQTTPLKYLEWLQSEAE